MLQERELKLECLGMARWYGSDNAGTNSYNVGCGDWTGARRSRGREGQGGWEAGVEKLDGVLVWLPL